MESLNEIDDIMDQFWGYGLNVHDPNGDSIGLWPEEMQRLIWCALNCPDGDFINIGSHCGGSDLLLHFCQDKRRFDRFKRGEKEWSTGKVLSVDKRFSEYFDLNLYTRGCFQKH